MGPPLAEGADCGIDDIAGSIKVGLANFKVDHALALRLKGAGFDQDFKGGFGTQARHALRQLEMVSDGTDGSHMWANPRIIPLLYPLPGPCHAVGLGAEAT